MTRAGQAVPFYLQRTLGGAGDLRSVHDERIGSDGTHATLRGFPFYRFRDRHLLLLQAEYRIPIWGPLDANLFAETGKVASRREDLELTVEGNRLKISGHRPDGCRAPKCTFLVMEINYGAFESIIELPPGYDLNQAEAKYQNGFLRIDVPEQGQSSPKSHSVSVSTSGD